MPSCSKAKHPSGIEINFFEDTHKYSSVINGKEILYTSGTQFLGNYYPPFDPTGEITRKCALKEGISVEELRKKWDDKKNNSCRLGTRCHECCEDILLNRELRNSSENDEEKRRFDNAVKMSKKIRSTIDILGVEKIVFSPDLRIAGTIDLFGQSKKDGSYLIIDHKTNAEIETFNKYNKFCLNPISHIPAISFHEYSLQLNLYAYLLKREKYVKDNAKFRFFLNHITPDSVKLIELPDRQTEIRELLIDWLLKTRS